MYQYICRYCGAHLDPGERCDCREKARMETAAAERFLVMEKETGQMRFDWLPERDSV